MTQVFVHILEVFHVFFSIWRILHFVARRVAHFIDVPWILSTICITVSQEPQCARFRRVFTFSPIVLNPYNTMHFTRFCHRRNATYKFYWLNRVKCIVVRLGYCFTPYQRLWLYNGAPLVAFYDTLGIRRTSSRLKPPASSRGKCIVIFRI